MVRLLSARLFQSGRSEAERHTEPEEALLDFKPGKAEQVSRLSQADLICEIGMQSFGIRIADRRLLLHLDRTLSERPEEAEVERVQDDRLLMPGAFHDGDLAVLHPVEDLLGLFLPGLLGRWSSGP